MAVLPLFAALAAAACGSNDSGSSAAPPSNAGAGAAGASANGGSATAGASAGGSAGHTSGGGTSNGGAANGGGAQAGGGASGAGGMVANVVGPSGGVVVGPDGASVTIPPGALQVDTTITIAEPGTGPALPPGVTSAGAVFDFGPSGLAFALAATVRVPVASGVASAVLYTQPAGGAWELVGGSTTADGFVQGAVGHFSLFQAALGSGGTGGTGGTGGSGGTSNGGAGGSTAAPAMLLVAVDEGADTIATDADAIYWTSFSKMSRLPRGTTTATVVATMQTPGLFALDATDAYVVAHGPTPSSVDDHVYKVAKTGGTPTELTTDTNAQIGGLAIDATNFYYVVHGNGGFVREVPKDMSSSGVDITNTNDGLGLAVDGTNGYLANDTAVATFPLMAGQFLNTIQGSDFALGIDTIVVNGGEVFWRTNGAIFKASTGGGAAKQLTMTPHGCSGSSREKRTLAVDATYVYWTIGCTVDQTGASVKGGEVRRMLRDGTGMETIATETDGPPVPIWVDDLGVYYGVALSPGRIMMIAK